MPNNNELKKDYGTFMVTGFPPKPKTPPAVKPRTQLTSDSSNSESGYSSSDSENSIHQEQNSVNSSKPSSAESGKKNVSFSDQISYISDETIPIFSSENSWDSLLLSQNSTVISDIINNLKSFFSKAQKIQKKIENLEEYIQKNSDVELIFFTYLANHILNIHPELRVQQQEETFNLISNWDKLINLENLANNLNNNLVYEFKKIENIRFFLDHISGYLPVYVETTKNFIKNECNPYCVDILNLCREILLKHKVFLSPNSQAQKDLTTDLKNCENLIQSLGGKIKNITPSQASVHRKYNADKANYQKTVKPVPSLNEQIIAEAAKKNTQEIVDHIKWLNSLTPEQFAVYQRDKVYYKFIDSLSEKQRESYKTHQRENKLNQDFIESESDERQQVQSDKEFIQSLNLTPEQFTLYKQLMKAQAKINQTIDGFLKPTVLLPLRQIPQNNFSPYQAQQQSVSRLSTPKTHPVNCYQQRIESGHLNKKPFSRGIK